MRRAASWRRIAWRAVAAYLVLLGASCVVRSGEDASPASVPPGQLWCFGVEVAPGCAVPWDAFARRAGTPAASAAAHEFWVDAPSRTGVVVVARGAHAPLALAVATLRPRAVAGVVLLDPSGFAASELLGSDLLNRLIYELRAAGRWFAREAFPHFGALDERIAGLPIDRVLARTDTNRLLERAADAGFPVVLLGQRASLTARHLESVLPLGRYVHGTDPAPWIAAVAAGTFDSEAHAVAPWALPRVEERGLVRFASLVFAASLVSEDLASIGVGLLLGAGRVSLPAALGVTAFALLLGDLLLVLGGRWLGAGLGVRAFPVPGEALFWSRFIPGARLPTYVAAGMNRMPLSRVVAWLGFAVVVWAPAIVLLTAGGGQLAQRFLGEERMEPVHVLLAVAAVLVLVRIGVPLLTWQGRRRFRGRLLRLTRFEYWPLAVFYAPLVPYLAWLAARHRSVRAPLLANPGIEGGGLVGESKWRIHTSFREGGAFLPATIFVPEQEAREAALARATAFAREHGFPLVGKPDVAERGRGVQRIHDEDDLGAYLSARDEDVLLQVFVPGIELGVFYVRHPARAQGEVFAIVRKELPSVTADGRRTVGELVLGDDRAVAMAATYRENVAARWTEIPEDGEEVPLVQIGTHSRGAVFLDGGNLRTPALAARIEDIARDLPGFFFGRLDLRAPDEEAVRAGRGLGLLEVNGLTAEAAHFYDPTYGVLDAYRWLFRQWRIAFEIGSENRRRGGVPPTLREISALWRRGRRHD